MTTVEFEDKHSENAIVEPKKLSFSLAERLVKQIPKTRDRLILSLMLYAGLKSRDIIELQAKDLNIKENILTIHFPNKKTISNIPQEVLNSLNEFKKQQKLFLFSSRIRPQLTLRSVQLMLKQLSKESNYNITSHTLRRLYLTNRVEEEQIKEESQLKRLDQKQIIPQEEFNQFINSIETERDQLIIQVLYETACTTEELISIQTVDINKESISFKESKKRKARTTRLSSSLSKRLMTYIRDKEGVLFTAKNGTPLSSKRILQIINEIATALALKHISLRTIRYTGLYHKFSQGISLKELSKQTGITHLSDFHLYGTLFIRKKNEA